MSHRTVLPFLAAFLIVAPLEAGAASAPAHGHAKAAKTAKKPAKPAAKPAKPAAKPAPMPPMGPGAMSHRPPTPMPSTGRRNMDVPQAKSLADTPDVVLNSRVHASLIAALSTSGQDIIPETTKGVVTLSGTVPTAQERARAEQVARKMRGVRAVKNRLTVKGKK